MAYYEQRLDPSDARQRVVFGTSGHRGSATDVAFNGWHILAITQAQTIVSEALSRNTRAA